MLIPGQRFRLVPFAGKLMVRQGMELEGIQPPPQVEGLAPPVEAGPRAPGPLDDVGHAAVPTNQNPLEKGLLGLGEVMFLRFFLLNPVQTFLLSY